MNHLLSLESIRNCLEGVVPSAVATADAEGLPNVTYISQVMYVDSQHIALSFQFFNKTRANILINPIAAVLMMDPDSSARYRLTVQYLRTETSGAVFERMRAKLAGIASHEGMEGVFRLRGADIYRVLSIEYLPGHELPPPPELPLLLPALRKSTDALRQQRSLDNLVDCLLDALDRYFAIRYSQLLMLDETGRKLYTLASRGYDRSGIGAEIPLGVGVIGIAAQHQVPIRIMFASSEYAYTRAVREQAIQQGLADDLEERIPLPGVTKPASQMAVPILSAQRLFAVLYVESQQNCQFGYDLEDALVGLCAQVGEAMHVIDLLAQLAAVASASSAVPLAQCPTPASTTERLNVRYHARDHSIFLDDEYLIKGVAGAILWRLLQIHANTGRCEFTNRELRIDSHLPLPEVKDNLDARLFLLSRRLAERGAGIGLEKTGRGRFALRLQQAVDLQED